MYKRLYRSRKEKMLGGVAGGIAEYFEIDPTLVRILFIVSLFLGGSGILAYIILWIVVPEEPYPSQTSEENKKDETSSSEQSATADTEYQKAAESHRQRRSNAAGIVLIVIGFIFLADNIFPRLDFDKFWPLVLIAVGVGLLLNAKKY